MTIVPPDSENRKNDDLAEEVPPLVWDAVLKLPEEPQLVLRVLLTKQDRKGNGYDFQHPKSSRLLGELAKHLGVTDRTVRNMVRDALTHPALQRAALGALSRADDATIYTATADTLWRAQSSSDGDWSWQPGRPFLTGGLAAPPISPNPRTWPVLDPGGFTPQAAYRETRERDWQWDGTHTAPESRVNMLPAGGHKRRRRANVRAGKGWSWCKAAFCTYPMAGVPAGGKAYNPAGIGTQDSDHLWNERLKSSSAQSGHLAAAQPSPFKVKRNPTLTRGRQK